VSVRTPLGRVQIALRNFESLKTVFSIFCREDYFTSTSRAFHVVDLGANVGIASLYFLTRNAQTTVQCYEPDPANLAWLQKNLQAFRSRVSIVERAVGVVAGTATLYCSEDGKYSSLIKSDHTFRSHEVKIDAFWQVLDASIDGKAAVLIKIDVEGLERDLVTSVQFEKYPNVVRLICESTDCSRSITKPHERKLRNGYIEDVRFDKLAATDAA
jgi:FkbM family methyltransferase